MSTTPKHPGPVQPLTPVGGTTGLATPGTTPANYVAPLDVSIAHSPTGQAAADRQAAVAVTNAAGKTPPSADR